MTKRVSFILSLLLLAGSLTVITGCDPNAVTSPDGADTDSSSTGTTSPTDTSGYNVVFTGELHENWKDNPYDTYIYAKSYSPSDTIWNDTSLTLSDGGDSLASGSNYEDVNYNSCIIKATSEINAVGAMALYASQESSTKSGLSSDFDCSNSGHARNDLIIRAVSNKSATTRIQFSGSLSISGFVKFTISNEGDEAFDAQAGASVGFSVAVWDTYLGPYGESRVEYLQLDGAEAGYEVAGHAVLSRSMDVNDGVDGDTSASDGEFAGSASVGDTSITVPSSVDYSFEVEPDEIKVIRSSASASAWADHADTLDDCSVDGEAKIIMSGVLEDIYAEDPDNPDAVITVYVYRAE